MISQKLAALITLISLSNTYSLDFTCSYHNSNYTYILAKTKAKLTKKEIQSNVSRLKKIVVRILKNNPKGVKLSRIWNLVKTESKQNFSAADCGVSKLSQVLQYWTDVIDVTDSPDPVISLQRGGSKEKHTAEYSSSYDVLFNESNFPALSKESQRKVSVKTDIQPKATVTDKSVKDHNTSDVNAKKGKLKVNDTDDDRTDEPSRVTRAAKKKSKKVNESPVIEGDLQVKGNGSEPNTSKQVSSTEKVTQGNGKISSLQKPSHQEGLFGLQWTPVNQFHLSMESKPSLQFGTVDSSGQSELPFQNIDKVIRQSHLQYQNLMLPTCFTADLQTVDSQISKGSVLEPAMSVSGTSGNNMFECMDSKPGRVKPIDKDEFETKKIDVRPVYIAKGKKPTKEQINNVAKECIEILSDADLFVTQERVEKLVCQRFSCHRLQDLGLRHIDQVECVNELNRLVCKINVYINAFVKTRSICTLHELKNGLMEYATDDGDFNSLKLGPLQRFPVVYQQFRFPPDQMDIPEITTMDILDHFNTYLDRKGLWRSRMELEPFMDYLVDRYDAENAYMLGVRIRSLPLALTVSELMSYHDS